MGILEEIREYFASTQMVQEKLKRYQKNTQQWLSVIMKDMVLLLNLMISEIFQKNLPIADLFSRTLALVG